MTGDAAVEAAAEFRRIWGHGTAFGPQEATRTTASGTGPVPEYGAGEVPVRVVADEPGERRVERMLVEVFDAAVSEILVTNAYAVPTPAVTDALVRAARRCVALQLVMGRIRRGGRRVAAAFWRWS